MHEARDLTDALVKQVATSREALRREAPGEWIALSSIASGGDRLFVREDRSMAFQALRSQGAAAEDALLDALTQPDRDSLIRTLCVNAPRDHRVLSDPA